ncbi:MAG: hypothetical protein ABIB61_00685, partial [Candidatus Shapirobacteria bacterium]
TASINALDQALYDATSAGITGSGTTNYLPIWTNASNLGNSVLYQASGNVGIGTTGPSYKLEVTGNGYFSDTLHLGKSGDALNITTGDLRFSQDIGDIYAYNSSAYKIVHIGREGSTTSGLFVDTNTGNVGIGTTGPSALLTVGAADNFRVDSSGNLLFSGDQTIGWSNDASNYYITDFAAEGAARIRVHGYAGVALGSNAGDVLTVNTAGNVGIGTTGPGAKLEVAGQLKITGGSPGTNKVLTSDSVGLASWSDISSVGTGGSGTANYLPLWTAGTTLGDSVLYQTSGNVGIGTTAPGNYKLNVAGYVSFNSGNIYSDSSNYLFASRFTDKDATNYYVDPGNTTIAGLFSGNVGIGTTGPGYKLEVSGTLGIGSTANFSSLINAANIGAGTDNSVLVLDTSGYLRTDEIDSRVWGTSLVDGSGGANQISYWSDPNTLAGSNSFWFDGANVGIGTTAPSAKLDIAGSTSTISNTSGDIYINPAGGDLDVGGRIQMNIDTDNDTTVGVCKSVADGTGTDMAFRECNGTPGDIAEYYRAQADLRPGDVVAIAGQSGRAVAVKTSAEHQTEAFGVVSTLPVGQFGKPLSTGTIPAGSFPTAISLVGKVPVKVSTQNGAIKVGDPLTTSEIPGVAVKATGPGKIIGYALESFDGSVKVSAGVREQEINRTKSITKFNLDPIDPAAAGVGKILLYMNLGWHDPDLMLTDTGDLLIVGQEGGSRVVNQSTGQTIKRILSAAEAVIGSLRAGRVETKKLVAEKIESPIVEVDQIIVKNEELKVLNQEQEEIMEIDGKEKKVSVFGDLAADGQIEAESIVAQEASFSALYAKEIVTNEGSLKEVLASKIAGVKKELEELVNRSASVPQEQDFGETGETTGSALAGQAENWSTAAPAANPALSGLMENTNPEEELILASNLLIQGRITVDSLVTNKQLLAGNLVLAGNSLISLDNALYLQPTGGKVDILAGILIIEDTGQVIVNGSLTVNGRLAASQFSGNDGDFVVSLGEKEESRFAALLVKDQNNETVASIDASGSATFAKVNVKSPELATESDQLATASAQLVSNASAGAGTLEAGQARVIIYTTQLTPESLVYITPTSDTQNQVLYVSQKYAPIEESEENEEITDPYFVVSLNEALENEVEFNWWLIN